MNIKLRITLPCDQISTRIILLSILVIFWSLFSLPTDTQKETIAADYNISSIESNTRRQFYLTNTTFSGGGAMTACASGYHMASLWEILDTSSLQYNSTLGFVRDDSGLGPPIGATGWVHTGFSNDVSATPGRGNCNGWTSNSPNDYGTGVYLPYLDWSTGGDIGVWKVDTEKCNASWWEVWCVENTYAIYLPLVLRN